jgi:hypothetical protein
MTLTICMSQINTFLLASNIYLLRSDAEMAGGSLARCQSLPDMMADDEFRGESGEAAAGTAGLHNTRSRVTAISYSEAEELALLGQQSPTHNHPDSRQFRDEGTLLLDYDSEGSQQGTESSMRRSTTAPAQFAAMDTDPGDNDIVSADVIPTMDSVYYQCRLARLATQKDTLISVSNDESYGRKAIVQSPLIGP